MIRQRIHEALDQKIMARVVYANVDVHEDSFENGEGKYVHSYSIDTVKGHTFPGVQAIIKAIDETMYADLEPKNFSLMEEEDGTVRLVTDVMQNEDGEKPSETEYAEWRAGKLALYSAFIDVKLEIYETRTLPFVEVDALFNAAGVTDRS